MMENFIIYLLKSGGLLIAFWICYRLFLNRITFFIHHRFYFIFGILTSFLLPFWELKKIIFIAPQQNPSINFKLIASTDTIAVIETNWYQILFIVYLIGVFIFCTQFVLQFYSLHKLLGKCEIKKEGKYRIAKTQELISPFSFFNTIVYNPNMYNENDIKTILVHEKIHADQMHSIDSILSHLLCIIQWANPIAWWFKRDIAQNLEYIADKYSIDSVTDKKAYQYLLLHQSGQNMPETSLINPFFNSLIKKRIVMLNQQKSKQINLLKFSFILPFLASFLLFFNTKTIAQVKESQTTEKNAWSVGYGVAVNKLEISVDKNSTNDELETNSKYLKEKANLDLKFSKIKRNNKGEITAIKSTYKTNDGQSGTYNVNSDEPIIAFVFSITMNDTGAIETIGYNSKSSSDNIISVIAKSNTQNNKAAISEDANENYNDLNVAEVIELPASNQKFILQSDSLDNKDPLIVINDEVQPPTFILQSLDVDNIAAINIIKDESAIKKYGVKANNGVIEITTKKNVIVESSNGKPLYVVDGKIVNSISDLNSDNIKEIKVLKDKSATDKYGDNGKNGVVEVYTKNNPWKVVNDVQIIEDMDAIIDIRTLLNKNIKNPYIFVNGKNMGKDYSKIRVKHSQIESISSFLPNEFTIKKYGELGKDGVIDIITKQ